MFTHVNLLVPPKSKKATFGFIVMEPEHTPPMSGSNSICVATVLLDCGLIQMCEPETTFFLEAPAGLVHVKAYCENGKAKSIEIHNVPSFADTLGVKLEVPGIGTLTVDATVVTALFSSMHRLLDLKFSRMRLANSQKPALRSRQQPTNKSDFVTQPTAIGTRFMYL